MEPSLELKPFFECFRRTKVRAYKQLAWSTASASQTKKLAVFQNRILRIATKAPYFVRNTTLGGDLQIDDLLDHIQGLTSKFQDRALQSKNPIVRVYCTKKFQRDRSLRRRRGPYAMTRSCTTSRTMNYAMN